MKKEKGLEAFKDSDSAGRLSPLGDDGCSPFIIDSQKITESVFFARLAKKTLLGNPNFPTTDYLTQTVRVNTHATYAASLLGLNVPLVQAIANLQYIGKPPYSYLSESIMFELSERAVSYHSFGLELAVQKMNLSEETLDYLRAQAPQLNHDVKQLNEYKLVDRVSKLCAIFTNLEDFSRVGLLDRHKLFQNYPEINLDFCLKEFVRESLFDERISFVCSPVSRAVIELKKASRQVLEKLNSLPGVPNADAKAIKDLYRLLKKHQDVLRIDPVTAIMMMTDDEFRQSLAMLEDLDVGQVLAIKAMPWVALCDNLLLNK
jgi:hypothetical protein